MSAAHTPGPWIVVMARFEGNTTYRPMTHVETAIAVEPADYWPEGHTPPQDDYGYFQPDDLMDCEEHRIATARLIAAAPDLLEALKDAHAHIADDALRARVGNLIAKATGAAA